jgi:HD-GYP domain-containing protein (c-di-GMP phosphodiesterase class II)
MTLLPHSTPKPPNSLSDVLAHKSPLPLGSRGDTLSGQPLYQSLLQHNMLQGISGSSTLLTLESDTDLIAALSPEASEELEATQALRHQRLVQQVEELAEQYHYSKLVSMFGVKLPNNQMQEWIYPMVTYALKQVFQAKGVHLIFSERDAQQQPRMILKGSTALVSRQQQWSMERFPVISAEQYEGYPLAYWLDMGHYSPKLLQPKEGRLMLGHPQLPHQETEAVLIIRMQLDRAHGDGLLVVTDCYEKLANPIYQNMLYKSALVLASAERLNNRSEHMKYVLKHEQAQSEGMTTLGDWQRFRNEFSQEVNIYSDLQQQFMLAMNHVIQQRMGVKDPNHHSATEYILKLASALELNEKTTDSLIKAALFMQLHKMHVREEQLRKQGAWDSEDFNAYYTSMDTSFSLLSHLYSLGDTLPYLRYMFERWDGEGRPRKLAGRNIPLGSRILGLVYAFTAMMEPKPYRTEPFPPEQAFEVLKKEAGTRWDPMLVDALHTCL